MGMKDADHDHHFFLDNIKQSVRKSPNRCPASAAADSWIDFRVASHFLKRLLDAKREVLRQSFTLMLIPQICFVEVSRGLWGESGMRALWFGLNAGFYFFPQVAFD